METRQNEIDRAIHRLDKSIIYQMSLNSHELFHSNLWAWLMEKDAGFVKIYFPELNGKDYKIEREQENRDITIWANGKAFVIENKFKSIPTEAQLVGYEEKLRGKTKFGAGVLTGIRKPTIKVGERPLINWKFLSYETIADGIDKHLLSEDNQFDQQTIEIILRYTAMVRDLCFVVNSSIECSKDHVIQMVAPSDDQYKLINIRDLLIKMHADAFCEKLRQDSRYADLQRLLPPNCQLIIEPGFSNKSGIVDAAVQVYHDNAKKLYALRIGVQIQGNQFRLFVSRGKAGKTSSTKELFEEYRSKKWFESYTQPPKVFKGRDTSMNPRKENSNGQYNKYESGTYWFVYQYFDIKNISDQEVAELIWEYLSQAIELL